MIDMQLGRYIEAFTLEVFEDYFGSSFRRSTNEEDLYLGTDCFIGGIPVDITLNPNKNEVKFIKKYMLEGITVNVLKRYGNGFGNFKRPVLVFHFETYELRDPFFICELIEEGLSKDIINEILGLYGGAFCD